MSVCVCVCVFGSSPVSLWLYVGIRPWTTYHLLIVLTWLEYDPSFTVYKNIYKYIQCLFIRSYVITDNDDDRCCCIPVTSCTTASLPEERGWSASWLRFLVQLRWLYCLLLFTLWTTSVEPTSLGLRQTPRPREWNLELTPDPYCRSPLSWSSNGQRIRLWTEDDWVSVCGFYSSCIFTLSLSGVDLSTLSHW